VRASADQLGQYEHLAGIDAAASPLGRRQAGGERGVGPRLEPTGLDPFQHIALQPTALVHTFDYTDGQ
jgi:hypothetical protein